MSVLGLRNSSTLLSCQVYLDVFCDEVLFSLGLDRQQTCTLIGAFVDCTLPWFLGVGEEVTLRVIVQPWAGAAWWEKKPSVNSNTTHRFPLTVEMKSPLAVRDVKAGDNDGNVSETIKLIAEDKRSTWTCEIDMIPGSSCLTCDFNCFIFRLLSGREHHFQKLPQSLFRS